MRITPFGWLLLLLAAAVVTAALVGSDLGALFAALFGLLMLGALGGLTGGSHHRHEELQEARVADAHCASVARNLFHGG